MKHNKKDKLEHHLMEYKRKSDQIEHRHHIGELNTEEWIILEKKLEHEYGVYCTGKDYVNFCKYLRLIGHSNHGKCNIKHDRNRRIMGCKKMVKIKKQKEFDKIDKKFREEEN